MATESLLPPNATALERAAETATTLAVDTPIEPVWSVADCPEALLPHLAWTVSVDVWGAIRPIAVRRETVRRSIGIHRRKGTLWAVREALRVCGYGDGSTVMEGLHNRKHDGSALYDAKIFHGAAELWATYRVMLGRPIANREVSNVRALITTMAPVRSEMLSLDYRAVANIHDGASRFDGAYNYGVAA